MYAVQILLYYSLSLHLWSCLETEDVRRPVGVMQVVEMSKCQVVEMPRFGSRDVKLSRCQDVEMSSC